MDDARSTPAQLAPDASQFAARLDSPLLAPRLSEDQVHKGLLLAREYGLASVIVRPEDADFAARSLGSSPVALASAVAWPEGSSTTAVKQYEARDLLRRGVREVHLTVSTGRMLARQFHHVESELVQIVQACAESGASCTALFDLAPLDTGHRVIACKLVRRSGVHCMAARGVDAASASFLRDRLADIPLKAFAPAASLDLALALLAAGASRLVLARPDEVVGEYRNRRAAAHAWESAPPAP